MERSPIALGRWRKYVWSLHEHIHSFSVLYKPSLTKQTELSHLSVSRRLLGHFRLFLDSFINHLSTNSFDKKAKQRPERRPSAPKQGKEFTTTTTATLLRRTTDTASALSEFWSA